MFLVSLGKYAEGDHSVVLLLFFFEEYYIYILEDLWLDLKFMYWKSDLKHSNVLSQDNRNLKKIFLN